MKTMTTIFSTTNLKCLRWAIVKTIALLTISLSGQTGEVSSACDSLHHRMLTIDTHIDTPVRLALPGFAIEKKYNHLEHYASIDISRLAKGCLDAGFWAIYSPQGPLTKSGFEISYVNAKRRLSQVKTMVKQQREHFRFAQSSSELSVVGGDGRHTIVLSIENAYPIGEDLDKLDEFYAAGVRMLGLVHVRNNQFADSSTDQKGARWNGLSPLGVSLVKRANQLGMILDASHASDQVLDQLLDISKAPIVLSHSGAKGVYEHPRNVGDRLLVKLAQSGGVISMNTYSAYLRKLKVDSRRSQERQTFIQKMYDGEDSGQPMTFQTFNDGLVSIDKKYPYEVASLDDYMQHFFHALNLLGPAHVGVGADWDGGGGVIGLEDVSMIPKITNVLMENGYSEEDLSNIWSGNIIRVFREVEKVARDLQR